MGINSSTNYLKQVPAKGWNDVRYDGLGITVENPDDNSKMSARAVFPKSWSCVKISDHGVLYIDGEKNPTLICYYNICFSFTIFDIDMNTYDNSLGIQKRLSLTNHEDEDNYMFTFNFGKVRYSVYGRKNEIDFLYYDIFKLF